MEYTTVSKTFTTLKDCKEARKQVIQEVCENLGVDRKTTRFPYDLLRLYGFNTYINAWVPLTRYVYDYSKWLNNENYSNYRIQTAKYGLKGKKLIS